MKRIAGFALVLCLGLMFCPTAQAQYKCVEGDCVSGKGKRTLADGSGYLEGEFWQGELVSGKVIFPNGDVFEGQFKDNVLVDGVKRFKSGLIHQGKFFSTILIDGKITDPDGSTHDIHLNAYKEPTPGAKSRNQPPRPR